MIVIEAIPAFSDNYIWCMYDDESNKAVVIDPGDASPVITALEDKNLSLEALLITHHHPDHTGGIDELLMQHPSLVVYGPQNLDINPVHHRLNEGEQVSLLGLDLEIIEVPGHTLDHIAFYCAGNAKHPQSFIFCGDTLFAGGCGRIFEGTPEMMLASLSKLSELPANTLIYCAHEYTLANLEFASAVEPNNSDLKARVAIETQKRSAGKATVPSTLATELKTNPFLRSNTDSVTLSASNISDHECTDSLAVFTVIRNWKNNF
jgi:hydroxyacylglutathione hydrolase